MTHECDLYLREVVEKRKVVVEAKRDIQNQLPNTVENSPTVKAETIDRDFRDWGEKEKTPLVVRGGSEEESVEKQVGELTIWTDFFVSTGQFSGRHIDYELEKVTVCVDDEAVEAVGERLKSIYEKAGYTPVDSV